jgi:hypothetical protein
MKWNDSVATVNGWGSLEPSDQRLTNICNLSHAMSTFQYFKSTPFQSRHCSTR